MKVTVKNIYYGKKPESLRYHPLGGTITIPLINGENGNSAFTAWAHRLYEVDGEPAHGIRINVAYSFAYAHEAATTIVSLYSMTPSEENSVLSMLHARHGYVVVEDTGTYMRISKEDQSPIAKTHKVIRVCKGCFGPRKTVKSKETISKPKVAMLK